MRISASIFTIFANKIRSISRQSDLTQARVNWCQIISSALLRSSSPADNAMRSLMAPTKPANAEVALFLSDRFFIQNTSFGDLVNLCYNILGQHPSHASPNKLPECQSFLLCFDARAFLCIIFQPNFSVDAKTFDVDAGFLIVAFSL